MVRIKSVRPEPDKLWETYGVRLLVFSRYGIAVEPEYKEHIFELSKRLHTGDEYSGLGIGLVIC